VGTLYRRFPTKDALFAAIVTARVKNVAARATELAASSDLDAGAAMAEGPRTSRDA